MDSATTTLFLGCILLSVRITPLIADPAPATGAGGAAAGLGGAGGAALGAGAGALGAGALGAGAGGAAAGAGGAASGAGAGGAASGAGAGGAASGAASGAGGAGAPSASSGATAGGAGAPSASSGASAGAPSAASGASAASGMGAAGAAPGAAAASAPGGATGGGSGVPPFTGPSGPQIVPCYFIFGDSLADSGNNNELQTLARANFLPYGVDYPDGPTGRFTNGRTYVDFIAEFLGFPKHIPPFAGVRGTERVLQGVNYASASAGIRPETGKIVGERINLDTQLDNHRATVTRIKQLKGNDEVATRDYLGKCLYTVGIGSNDYMNNYLVAPANPKDVVFTPDTWAEELAKRINAFLRALHDLGAKKVVLYGLGPIGCEPSQVKALRMAGKQGCVDTVNHIVSLYNGRLPGVIDDVNRSFPDARFIFINNSHISPGTDPGRIGVKVGDKPCCPTEAVAGSCVRGSAPCPNRSEYSFFDNYHPTEKAVLPGARRSWEALEPQDTYPMDISHLARLALP